MIRTTFGRASFDRKRTELRSAMNFAYSKKPDFLKKTKQDGVIF